MIMLRLDQPTFVRSSYSNEDQIHTELFYTIYGSVTQSGVLHNINKPLQVVFYMIFIIIPLGISIVSEVTVDLSNALLLTWNR